MCGIGGIRNVKPWALCGACTKGAPSHPAVLSPSSVVFVQPPGAASLWPPASALHEPRSFGHALDPFPGRLAEAWCSLHLLFPAPVIDFPSELIAKSIWSGEKTSPQLAMESGGREEASPLHQHGLERQGGGETLPHAACRRSTPPRSGPNYPPFIFLSLPFKQKSTFQEPFKGMKCRLSYLSVRKKHLGSSYKMQMPKHLSPEFHPVSLGWSPELTPVCA